MIRCARSMARTCRRINFAVLHFHGCATRVAQLGYLYRRRMSWRKSTGEPMAKPYPTAIDALKHAQAASGTAVLHESSLDRRGLLDLAKEARKAADAAVKMLERAQ